VEAGSVRFFLICGDPRAATPAKWGAYPSPMVGGPHLSGGVLSLLEYLGVDVRVSLDVNLTYGPPFVIILVTPYSNRHSPKLVEIVSKNPKSMVMFSFIPVFLLS